MASLAFLGLGAMGAPMAARLIGAGHAVTVWNRTRARADAIDGAARIADSPADAARDAEAVVTMLATPEAVSEVLFGPDGVTAGIAADTTLIEMSTIGPDNVAALRDRAPEGVEVLDVPVLGGVSDAAGGTLTLYFGAGDASFARWRDVLAPPPGAGAAMKLVANSTLAGLMSLIGEALALADGFGLDDDVTLSALLDSPIGPALKRKLDKIESGRYVASFTLSLMRKDMGLVTEAARRRDVELRAVAGAARWFDDAEQDGLGGCDYSAAIARIRRRDASC
jgi:3-hydroxyisobutyrate dehydrogenase/2-hydroxy-3-oxopropionate reductase